MLTFVASAQHTTIQPSNELLITGAVRQELHISAKELLQFRQEEIGDAIIHNKQGDVKEHATNMKGVLLKTVLDSAHIFAARHKEYNELCIILTASDNYRNVYSWNELFNTEVGDLVYIITEKDGIPIDRMEDRILVISRSDKNSGRRHLKALTRIEVKKV